MRDAEPITRDLLRRIGLPVPGPHTDKNSRGTVLVAGSSATSVGAASLSGLAAFRSGAGKVLLAVPAPLAIAIGAAFPEAGVHGISGTLEGDPTSQAAASQIRPLLSHVDAALIGPGLTNESSAQELAALLLDTSEAPAFVIDGLSITGLWPLDGKLHRHHPNLVITPHAGEMAKLMDTTKEDIDRDAPGFAMRAAAHLQCVVVLKGETTVVCQPDGPTYFHTAALPGLATSGSGDVLAGILAALLARGAAPMDAAMWSVFLHAAAGKVLSERIGLGFLARELPAEIPPLMRSIVAA